MIDKKVVLFNLIFFWLITTVTGQISYVSHDNYTGIWLDDNSWTNVESWAPQNPSHPTTGVANGIDVYGYITRMGDLTINNGDPMVIIYDTLVVDGNTVLGSGASLGVPANGVLVLTGNLTIQGAFNLGNLGRVVVGGDVNVTNGRLTNHQDFYVLGTTSTSGGGTISGSSSIGNESDLNTNDPPLADFVRSLGVLPVELIFFDAHELDDYIVLQWATASELNNDYFEIQRSGDGKNFKTIGVVEGNGTAYHTIHYNFKDRSPLKGVNYYRLKQYDFDGAFAYSPVVRAFFEAEDTGVKVYPNPAAEKIQITLDHRFINTKTQLWLYNSHGGLVSRKDFVPDQITSTFGLQDVEISGVYFLQVKNGTFEEFVQVLISK